MDAPVVEEALSFSLFAEVEREELEGPREGGTRPEVDVEVSEGGGRRMAASHRKMAGPRPKQCLRRLAPAMVRLRVDPCFTVPVAEPINIPTHDPGGNTPCIVVFVAISPIFRVLTWVRPLQLRHVVQRGELCRSVPSGLPGVQ